MPLHFPFDPRRLNEVPEHSNLAATGALTLDLREARYFKLQVSGDVTLDFSGPVQFKRGPWWAVITFTLGVVRAVNFVNCFITDDSDGFDDGSATYVVEAVAGPVPIGAFLLRITKMIGQAPFGAGTNIVHFVGDYGDATKPQFEEIGEFLVNNNTTTLVAGDNNYPNGGAGTIAANTAAIQPLIDVSLLYPCLGNHDLDAEDFSIMTLHYPHVPNDLRYYRIDVSAHVDLIVLNSGKKSNGVVFEPDGIAVGSDQYDWFVAELAASTKPWKLIMFHHPFVVPASAADRRAIELDWPEFKAAGNIIVNGHAHQSYHLRHTSGLNIFNASFVGQSTNARAALHGATSGMALRWFDNTTRLVGRFDFSAANVRVLFQRPSDGATLYRALIEA